MRTLVLLTNTSFINENTCTLTNISFINENACTFKQYLSYLKEHTSIIYFMRPLYIL